MKYLRLLLFLFFAAPAFAQVSGIPPRPVPAKLVNNLSQQFPDFLSQREEEALESKLEKFSNETSNQVVVVITDDLGGNDINTYATRIGINWGVGQNKFDNGVVVVIKPTGGEGQRDAYIAVGTGLEGAIPDVTAKHIVEKEIAPQFENGNYYAGLNSAADVIMKLAKREINSKDYDASGGKPFGKGFFLAGFVIILLLLILLIRILRGGGGGFGGGMASGFFIGGSGWGRGGGGFGGGGGGGFGGFGGGGFGGGGGGGKW